MRFLMRGAFLKILFLFLIPMFTSCGSASDTIGFDTSIVTQSPPLIKRVEPTSGRAGDAITLFGLGFSNEPAKNIILVGEASTQAQSYNVSSSPADGEFESITFAIPSGAKAGTGGVIVIVLDWTSNDNVPFTVLP